MSKVAKWVHNERFLQDSSRKYLLDLDVQYCIIYIGTILCVCLVVFVPIQRRIDRNNNESKGKCNPQHLNS